MMYITKKQVVLVTEIIVNNPQMENELRRAEKYLNEMWDNGEVYYMDSVISDVYFSGIEGGKVVNKMLPGTGHLSVPAVKAYVYDIDGEIRVDLEGSYFYTGRDLNTYMFDAKMFFEVDMDNTGMDLIFDYDYAGGDAPRAYVTNIYKQIA